MSQTPSAPDPEDAPGQQDASPAPPPPAPPSRRPPAWFYIALPLVILLAAFAVVLAIIVTDDNPAPVPAARPERATATAVASTPSPTPEPTSLAPPAAAPTSMREAVTGYAASFDLDAAAFGTCLATGDVLATVAEQFQRGIALGVNGTPTFFINNKIITGAQPSFIFLEVIDAELAGSPTSIEEYSDAVQILASAEQPQFGILPGRPNIEGAAIEGSPDAPVIIVEFSDFQCPFCQRWFLNAYPDIRERIGEDVAIVFMHFPLTSIHPNAEAAHLAAECAREQGKFWEMHDILFDRQAEWSPLPIN